MIHFRLKDFDKIIPIGQAPDEYLSWFWLTDGELWLTFGDITIYEYSNRSSSLYNDYYLVRFLEDFTDCFEKINEPISEKMFSLTRNSDDFLTKSREMYGDEVISDDEYEIISRWVLDRSFDSAHLVGGPLLFFFRFENTIRIVWKTEWILDNGISLWSAKNGYYDMDFDLFAENVKKFGVAFFEGMDKIVATTLESNLKNVRIDKKHVEKEHQERKNDFYKKLALLEQMPVKTTNWEEIENCVEKLFDSTSTK
jgi:Family of unknown function (DUF5984)